ncbi:hypothetical protein SKAU_G00286500 [Synaphobranchus kaupii]|uniref:Uncharacterized protein n=1 Tax=Synaphobranchus kaupii TaxID=118154 RepID=A0A9Q1EYC2_SYNKA|nr:hypothetical protein SKAU_G00286500 [Synaphobranchus kaupii]
MGAKHACLCGTYRSKQQAVGRSVSGSGRGETAQPVWHAPSHTWGRKPIRPPLEQTGPRTRESTRPRNGTTEELQATASDKAVEQTPSASVDHVTFSQHALPPRVNVKGAAVKIS